MSENENMKKSPRIVRWLLILGVIAILSCVLIYGLSIAGIGVLSQQVGTAARDFIGTNTAEVPSMLAPKATVNIPIPVQATVTPGGPTVTVAPTATFYIPGTYTHPQQTAMVQQTLVKNAEYQSLGNAQATYGSAEDDGLATSYALIHAQQTETAVAKTPHP